MPDVSIAPGFGIGYQGFLSDGHPNNGGKIRTYLATTTTPAATYTSQAGNVPNTNPIVLLADGRPPNPIWLDNSQLYKFVLEDALGNVLGTFDNIEPPASATGLGDWTGPAFLANRATPGYQRLPSGLLIQWGATGSIASNASATWGFPLAFPTALLSAQATAIAPAGAPFSTTPVSAGVRLDSNVSVSVFNWSTVAASYHMLAIGY